MLMTSKKDSQRATSMDYTNKRAVSQHLRRMDNLHRVPLNWPCFTWSIQPYTLYQFSRTLPRHTIKGPEIQWEVRLGEAGEYEHCHFPTLERGVGKLGCRATMPDASHRGTKQLSAQRQEKEDTQPPAGKTIPTVQCSKPGNTQDPRTLHTHC